MMGCQARSARDVLTLLPICHDNYYEIHKPTVAIPQVKNAEGITTCTSNEDQVGLVIGESHTEYNYVPGKDLSGNNYLICYTLSNALYHLQL